MSGQRIVARLANSPDGEPRRAGAGRRLPLFMALLFAQGMVIAWLLPKDLVLAHRIARLFHPNSSASFAPRDALQLRRDPSVGSIVPRAIVASLLRRATGIQRGRILLVYIGNSACCVHADVAAWEREALRHGLGTLLLSDAPRDDYSEQLVFVRERLGLQSPLVLDPQKRLTRFLNAFCVPRAYLFARHWRLRWIQRTVNKPYFDLFSDSQLRATMQGED